MALVKSIMRREIPRQIACWSVAQYLRLLDSTVTWSVEGEEIPRAMLANKQPFILAFWHGRMLMMLRSWQFSEPFHMVISQHPDGQLIARTIEYLGIDTIAGSTSRGGSGALRAMVRRIKAGECVGITPDGPGGPRMRASAGIVQTARLAGVPIIPGACAARPRRVVGSWDRLVVPLPFGRGLIAWDPPMEIDSDADDAMVEALRAKLELRLNEMTRALDDRLGLDPVEPAPQAAPPTTTGVEASS